MSSYNLTKRADRERLVADRRAEIAAIDNGAWPRDINDSFRWSTNTNRTAAAHARAMCLADIEYAEGIPARISAGELPGWEP